MREDHPDEDGQPAHRAERRTDLPPGRGRHPGQPRSAAPTHRLRDPADRPAASSSRDATTSSAASHPAVGRPRWADQSVSDSSRPTSWRWERSSACSFLMGGESAPRSPRSPTSIQKGRGCMAELRSPTPIARSPIAPPGPVVVRDGWEVSGRPSSVALTLADCTPMPKWIVRGDGAFALPFGHAERDSDTLVVGSGPGEWTVLGGHRRPAPAGNFVSVIDVTHGRALLRLTGAAAASLLAKVCAIDLSDRVTPNGAAFAAAWPSWLLTWCATIAAPHLPTCCTASAHRGIPVRRPPRRRCGVWH